MQNEFKEVLYEKDEETGIVTVTLNNPAIKNALTVLILLELFWAVDAMEKDETARAMIITGAKDPNSDDPAKEAFCSGAYFNPKYMESLDD